MRRHYLVRTGLAVLCLLIWSGCFGRESAPAGSNPPPLKNPKKSSPETNSQDEAIKRIEYYREQIEKTLHLKVDWEAIVAPEKIRTMSLWENFLYVETTVPKLHTFTTDIGFPKWILVLNEPMDFPLVPTSGLPQQEMKLRELIKQTTKEIDDEEKRKPSDEADREEKEKKLQNLSEMLTAYKAARKELALHDFIYYIAKSTLHCVDRYTGSETWRARLDFVAVTTPAATLTTVYIGSLNHPRLYIFDVVKRFAPYWFATTGAITTNPIYEDGAIYIADETGKIYSFNTTEGKLRWAYPTERAIKAELTLDGDTIYVGSTDFAFYAIDKFNGVLNWKYETGHPITTKCNVGTRWVVKENENVAEQTAYVRVDNDALYALLIEHIKITDRMGNEILIPRAKLRWKLPEAKTFLMYGAASAYLLGMDNNILYVVQIDSGQVKAKYSLKEFPFRIFDPKNGIIYLGTDDGYIFSVREPPP